MAGVINASTGISVALVVALGGALFWTGALSQRVTNLEHDLVTQDEQHSATNKAQWSKLSTMERLVTDVAVMRSSIKRILEKLDRSP